MKIKFLQITFILCSYSSSFFYKSLEHFDYKNWLVKRILEENLASLPFTINKYLFTDPTDRSKIVQSYIVKFCSVGCCGLDTNIQSEHKPYTYYQRPCSELYDLSKSSHVHFKQLLYIVFLTNQCINLSASFGIINMKLNYISLYYIFKVNINNNYYIN